MLFWIFEVFPVILFSFNYISRLLVSYLCVYIYRTSLFKRRWEGKSSSKLIRIDDEKFCQTMGETKNGVTNWGWGEGLSFKKFDHICYRGFYFLITNTECKHTWVGMWFPTITIKVHLIGIFTFSKTCPNSHKVPLATNCLVSQFNFRNFFKHPMQVVSGLLTTRATWCRKPIS